MGDMCSGKEKLSTELAQIEQVNKFDQPRYLEQVNINKLEIKQEKEQNSSQNQNVGEENIKNDVLSVNEVKAKVKEEVEASGLNKLMEHDKEPKVEDKDRVKEQVEVKGLNKLLEHNNKEETKYNKGPSEYKEVLQSFPLEKLSQYTKESYNKLGVYQFKSSPDEKNVKLEPYQLENGIYEGQWFDGKKHGQGKMIYNDGSLYEGNWEKDLKWGQGRFLFSDGDIYSGEFQNDIPHGQGTLTQIDGCVYTGGWAKGLQDGEGVEKCYKMEGENRKIGSEYKGYFKGGKKTGKGEIQWINGSSYKGDFFDNNLHGEGEYIWDNGNKYVGIFKSNLLHGQGIFTNGLNGQTKKGQWEYGRFLEN